MSFSSVHSQLHTTTSQLAPQGDVGKTGISDFLRGWWARKFPNSDRERLNIFGVEKPNI